MFDRSLAVREPAAPEAAPTTRRKPKRAVLQAKLRVGASDDPAEREADRIADAITAVLRRGGPPPATSFGSSVATRIARSTTNVIGRDGGDVPADVARAIGSSRGVPLEAPTRSRMESAMGVDLGDVRIHRDSPVAPRIQASAFTVGSDIHFAPGEFRPESGHGQWLLSHELAHVAQQGAAGPVRRYTTQSDPDGDTWRVSESGKTALWVSEKEGGQALYTTPDRIKDANKKLRKAGTNGSFVRLSVDDTRGLKAGLLTGVSTDACRVIPRLVTVGPDPGNKKLKLINKGKSQDDDGSKAAEFALWADCGRSSRAVMGTDDAGPMPSAQRTIGATPANSKRSAGPSTYTDIYRLAMKQFMKVAAHKQYLQDGVHYHKILAWKSFVTPSSDKEAKKLYWALGKAGRKAFDTYTGTNLAANPEIGGGYTLVTEKKMPGFASAGETWNFHWAGVVMKDGPNNITLENYAVSYGTDPDPVKNKELAQKSYDEVNRKYLFQMYGTAKKGQTFHEEHIASGTHGNRGSTFAVKV